MISDEERREVAATMMAISCRGVKDLTLGEVLNSILTGGAPRPTTEMAILARLADLIDRPVTHSIAEHPGFKCKLCGDEWPLDIGFDYCPRCGAEVVS